MGKLKKHNIVKLRWSTIPKSFIVALIFYYTKNAFYTAAQPSLLTVISSRKCNVNQPVCQQLIKLINLLRSLLQDALFPHFFLYAQAQTKLPHSVS